MEREREMVLCVENRIEMTGKTVLVTGSSRGIGLAIAQHFCTLGANVILCGTSDTVKKEEEKLKQAGFSVASAIGNIGKPEDAERMVQVAVQTFGTLDILVNNAGITKDGLLIRMNESDWDDVLDVNLKGAFLMTKAAARVMMKKRVGRIINITSVVGVSGNAGQANYAASKAGMIGLTKSVAKELAARNITCNAIAPGFIETQMTDTLSDSVKESYLKSIPLGRVGLPSEVAALAGYLASDAAAYITGQVVHIDGGLYM